MVLADWGASVIRIDRVGAPPVVDLLCRGKRSLAVNLRKPEGRALVKTLVSTSDILIDPYRPGTLERLGLGPDVFLGEEGLNTKLIYAKLSGFPTRSSQKDMSGHDLNYLSRSGILSMLPGTMKPTFPLNLLADFGGGGMMCAMGILLALIARNTSGKGQVVQTDMVSGTRYLSSYPLIYSLLPNQSIFGQGNDRGRGILDGGAPFYQVYTCKDGKWISVGCIEPRFFRIFLELFLKALPDGFAIANGGWIPSPSSHGAINDWPRLKEFLEAVFMTKSRDEWAVIFHNSDACVEPVLTPQEASVAAGSAIPLPHPHLSVTRSHVKESNKVSFILPGEHSEEILNEVNLGYHFQNLLEMQIIGVSLPKFKL